MCIRWRFPILSFFIQFLSLQGEYAYCCKNFSFYDWGLVSDVEKWLSLFSFVSLAIEYVEMAKNSYGYTEFEAKPNNTNFQKFQLFQLFSLTTPLWVPPFTYPNSHWTVPTELKQSYHYLQTEKLCFQ